MKILTYNPDVVNPLIKDKKLPERFLVDNWEDIFHNCMENKFSSNYFLYDRTGAIPHFLNIDDLDSKIPQGTLTKAFKEVCEQRAKYLLSLGKPLNVSWSGGIDSTLVLFCLNKFAQDKDQITVYCTYNSVIESGYLFDRYIKDRIKYKIKINSPYKENYENNQIYITGSMSNQLFTPGVKYHPMRDSFLNIKDSDFIKQNAFRNIEDILDDKILRFIKPSLDKFPKTIKSLQELRQFIIFNFTWRNVSAHHKIGINNPNVISFFHTDDFQRWAMYNTDEPTKIGDFSDERWQIRELIEEYTGDSLYTKHKKKATSVLSGIDEDWLFLMNDQSNIYMQDL
jgi:hypothetical protein